MINGTIVRIQGGSVIESLAGYKLTNTFRNVPSHEHTFRLNGHITISKP